MASPGRNDARRILSGLRDRLIPLRYDPGTNRRPSPEVSYGPLRKPMTHDRRHDSAGNGWWRSDRSVSLLDSIDALLDDIERLVGQDEQKEALDDAYPIVTGLHALDELCGGVRSARLTLIEADHLAQANALVCTIARTIEYPTLVAVQVVQDATTWILAGETGIPAVLIAHSLLTKDHWSDIASAIGRLGEQGVRLTETATIKGISYLCQVKLPVVLVVQGIERFGPVESVAPALMHLAENTGMAVLATCQPIAHTPDWGLQGCTHISMHTHGLTGRATLVTSNELDPLNVYQAAIEPLVADFR